MVEAYLRQSPLAHVHLNAVRESADTERCVTIGEVPFRQQYALRGSSSDEVFVSAVEGVLSIPLPLEPCRSSGDADGIHILWMGADEWLIIAPENDDSDCALKLDHALAGQHASVVDVSASRTTVRIEGTKARETLSKGCSIDLHPRAFHKGKVVNTLLAQAHVTLHQIAENDTQGKTAYDIFVHRSFAEYLWAWLIDATDEYK